MKLWEQGKMPVLGVLFFVLGPYLYWEGGAYNKKLYMGGGGAVTKRKALFNLVYKKRNQKIRALFKG